MTTVDSMNVRCGVEIEGAPFVLAMSWQSLRQKVPEKPLLVSGAIGGPTVIWLCTPLRNGLTLGSKDKKSNIFGLYRKVFRGGVHAGWTGGLAPAVVACPQFLALGPLYHFINGSLAEAIGATGGPSSPPRLCCSAVAALGASLGETMLTFGSQARNAQMAYNNSFVHFASVVDGSRKNVPLTRARDVWGVGAEALLVRNFLSIFSIRSFSPWLRERLPDVQGKVILSDALASLSVCIVTAPVHQLFNFLATTPEAKSLGLAERFTMARQFLREQYFVPLPREVMLTADLADLSKVTPQQEYSWRISPVALRDFGMRAVYITTVMSLFVGIERTLCSLMREMR